MKRAGVVIILFLAFFGLSDSIYIAQSEVNNTPLICNAEVLSGCNIVSASQYSYLFGIPIAEYGAAFYAFIFIIAAFELALYNQLLRRVLQVSALAGVVISAILTLVEIFVIQALCIFCIASALIVLAIFIVSILINPKVGPAKYV